jgi:predicted nucleic acid-binding protein
MTGAYFDVSYLAKLHWREPGTAAVEVLARGLSTIACGIHGRMEFAAVGHRKVREKAADLSQAQSAFAQLQRDTVGGGIIWLPLEARVYRRVESFFINDPGSVFLRASDALHLACAAEHGFTEVYSNDRHFLAAAPLFGLRGVNVIGRDE